MSEPYRTATVVIGGWWGDEGKGKVISYLALGDNYLHIARAGVGTNAGHTVFLNGRKYGLRMIPSGFTNPNTKLYIGKGVLVDPGVLLDEVEKCQVAGRVHVDSLCPIIEERHKVADRSSHYKDSIGTTGTGSSPAQLERISRSRCMRFVRDIDELSPYRADVSELLTKALKNREEILVEMTQGTMLSLYGFEINGELTYHNATSKDTTAGTACADVGIGPTAVKDVIAVYKSIPSRVGPGIFLGELSETGQEKLRAEGKGECGTVSGRPRRLGAWTDEVFKLARRTAENNGATQIALTKLDMGFEDNASVRDYKKLTPKARAFIERLEDEICLPVTLIGTGQDVYDIIDRR